MNERTIRKSLLSITVGLLGRGQFAAYPTLERARELFPSGRLLADGMNDSSDDLCAYAVAGNRKRMSPSDFAAFTNRLVTVSGANEEERKELFWALDGS